MCSAPNLRLDGRRASWVHAMRSRPLRDGPAPAVLGHASPCERLAGPPVTPYNSPVTTSSAVAPGQTLLRGTPRMARFPVFLSRSTYRDSTGTLISLAERRLVRQ